MLGSGPAAVGGATTAGTEPNMSLYTFVSESIPLSPTTPTLYTTSPHTQPHLYTLHPTGGQKTANQGSRFFAAPTYYSILYCLT